jgi:hypothetical protein
VHLVIGRIAGGLAGASTAVGAGLVLVAMEGRRFTGYVSEAGVLTEPGSRTYRFGLLLIAGALLLLAVAARPETWVATALLVGAALTTTVSASVPCSGGCPLPPYEESTTGDLVHAGASILGVGLFALALAALAIWARDPWLRRIGRVGAGLLIPLGFAIGVLILAVGRGQVTSVLERTILGIAVLACIAVGARTAARTSSPPDAVPVG